VSKHLMYKAWRDYAFFGFGTMLLLCLFVIVFVNAVHATDMEQYMSVMKTPWIRNLLRAMVGADIVENFDTTGLVSFAFAHPVMWTMVISFTLLSTSGLIAGEVDRGTFDFVATLPVSRTRIYLSYSFVTLIWSLMLVAALYLGAWLGMKQVGYEGVNYTTLVLVSLHLLAAIWFVGAMGIALSGMCNRRVAAGAICFVYILYSFTLNVVEAFWPAAQKVGWTGFMHYYQPLPVARDGKLDPYSLAVLVGASSVIWIVGLLRFTKRDIPSA